MMPRQVPAVVSPGGADGSGEIMLFGVRVKVDPMRKSVSMNNLSEYQQPNIKLTNDKTVDVSAAVAGYVSADDAGPRHPGAGRERKRGIPWTEEEHKLFLLGLEKVGKGDWRGISRNFVKTRTSTQVASHAQKYFLRKSNLNRRRRRSSLFDITTDSVAAIPMEEEHVHQDNELQQAPETPNIAVAPYPVSVGPVVNTISGQVNDTSPMFSGSISVLPFIKLPAPSSDIDFSQTSTNNDPTLSLNLSLSYDLNNQLPSRQSVHQVADQNLSNGGGMISVA